MKEDEEKEEDVLDYFETIEECMTINWGCDYCSICSHYKECNRVGVEEEE